MLPKNARNLWKRLYILSGRIVTIQEIADYINRNPNGHHLGYPAQRMLELGYIEKIIMKDNYKIYIFTEKFLREIEQ